MWLPFSPIGANPFWFATSQPFGVYTWQAYVPSHDCLWPMPGMHQVTAPLTASSKGVHPATHLTIPQPFQQYGETYRFGAQQSHLIAQPSLQGVEGSFLGSAPPNGMVDFRSVVGFQPGYSGVMIGYQVDECTCTWLAGHFTA